MVSFPSLHSNLSAPGPPVSWSLHLPIDNKLSLPAPPTFSELHIPLIVVTLSLIAEMLLVLLSLPLLLTLDVTLFLDIMMLLDDWLESPVRIVLEFIMLPFTAFVIKSCILDFKSSL